MPTDDSTTTTLGIVGLVAAAEASIPRKSYSLDFRYRVIVLRYLYSMPVKNIYHVMGCSARSTRRWLHAFEERGCLEDEKQVGPNEGRYSSEVYGVILDYVKRNPTFYIEELQEFLKKARPEIGALSIPTLCRVLRHDLNLTRKIIEKNARCHFFAF